MLKTLFDFENKKTVSEALGFYIFYFLFFAAIIISFKGTIGEALISGDAEVAESAYHFSFWMQPLTISVTCLLLLHNAAKGKQLKFSEIWHLYTLTLLLCLTLGLTAGLVTATLVTMLDKKK